ncbi:MAG: hypothetical protein PVF91_15630 [Chromatiales bacterium]|jgi:hypothetical protein
MISLRAQVLFLGALMLAFVGDTQAAPKIEPLPATGAGFVLTSDDFGDPCAQDLGGRPVLYLNQSVNVVDVTVQVANLGDTNLFLEWPLQTVGIVIPPYGDMRRPRIVRVTLNQGDFVRVGSQQAINCAWSAIVQPH